MVAHGIDDLLIFYPQNLPDIFRPGKSMPDRRLLKQVIVPNYSRLLHPLQLLLLAHIFADVVQDARHIRFVLILAMPLRQQNRLLRDI